MNFSFYVSKYSLLTSENNISKKKMTFNTCLKKIFFSGVGRGSKVYFKVPTSTSRPIDPRMYRTNANHDMATDIGIWTTDDYKMIVTKQLHANY